MSSENVSWDEDKIPYWLVNVPKSQWTAKCPDFIANASERDRNMLSIPDSQYHRLSWEDVQEIIKTNQIDRFKRMPSDIRRYLAYIADLKREYGSVVNFIVEKRLQWTDRRPKDANPFDNPKTDDIRILYNDWPYGIDKKIIHLVVWTKFDLDEDPAADDLTPFARQKIDDYVNRTFRTRVPAKDVIWFKNWKSLKSVHAIEHFHVMLYNPDMDFIKDITRGDISASQVT